MHWFLKFKPYKGITDKSSETLEDIAWPWNLRSFWLKENGRIDEFGYIVTTSGTHQVDWKINIKDS